jgi:hypothetical protein
VIGVSLEYNEDKNSRLEYFRNGVSLGVLFEGTLFPYLSYYPAVSIVGQKQVTIGGGLMPFKS